MDAPPIEWVDGAGGQQVGRTFWWDAYATPTVLALAYDVRYRHARALVPILADALQDAGCPEEVCNDLRAGQIPGRCGDLLNSMPW